MADPRNTDQSSPAGSGAATGEEVQRRRDLGWLARLRASLGLGPDVSLRQSLETALEQPGQVAAAFSPEERLMLLNILGFRELRVEDVMVPRADIISVEQGVMLGELLTIFRRAGHSRIPVYRDTLDDPVGMVHIKDLMSWLTQQAANGRRQRGTATPATPADAGAKAGPAKKAAGVDLARIDLGRSLVSAKIMRPVLFVPASMPAVDLLVKMQATRNHMALVIDEYGGTDGLATIEDLVEEIVGDIEDEHDPSNEVKIEPVEDGGYIADARFAIEDFRALIGQDLGLSDAEEDVDTLGGLVFSLLGRIPVRGEIVTYPGGLEFEVLDADPRRIKRLKVFVKAPPPRKRRGRKGDDGEGKAQAG